MRTSAFILGTLVGLLSVLPLRIRLRYKILLTLILYAVAFKGQIQQLFGGPLFFAPDLPGALIRFNSAMYGVFILFGGMLLFSLVLQYFFYMIRWKGRISKEKLFAARPLYNRINLGLLILSVLLAGWGLVNGSKMPEIKVLPCAVKNLPPEAAGMKIVFLTDLHVDKVTAPEEVRTLVERTNALVPDLVLLGGDLVDGRLQAYGRTLEKLSGLKARYGVYAVPGNHEYYSGFGEWKTFLTQTGIELLLNRTVRLPNGLYLSGVTDPAAKRFGHEMPDLGKVMKEIPQDAPAVYLCHRPRLAEKAAEKYSLFLSGHTHGGMVRGMDLLVKAVNDNYVSGLYRVKGMDLYVSNGTGIWRGFPLRLGRPSEITLVILSAKK